MSEYREEVWCSKCKRWVEPRKMAQWCGPNVDRTDFSCPFCKLAYPLRTDNDGYFIGWRLWKDGRMVHDDWHGSYEEWVMMRLEEMEEEARCTLS